MPIKKSPAKELAGFIANYDASVAKLVRQCRSVLRKRLPTVSAGAHLVALVATNPEYLKAHRLVPKTTLAGVMAIDTASYDLASTRTLAVRKMIRDAFGDDQDTLASASPLLQAKANRDACPPFIVAVVKQRPEAWQESVAFKNALPSSKLIVMDYPQSGQLKAHAKIAMDLLDRNNEMTRQLLEFVKNGKW